MRRTALPKPQPTPIRRRRLQRLQNALFVNDDCVRAARAHLADDSVDLVVTDPPFGIKGATLHRHYNRDERFVVDGYIDVPADEYGDFSRRWVAEAARVLRPGGSIYIVSGWSRLYEVLDALHASGLVEISHIIWKYQFGVWATRKWISSHYHILLWCKPGADYTYAHPERGAEEDVWFVNRVWKRGKTKNKNELPPKLVERMIAASSRPGDLVADFFLGGGSTARSALAMGRRVVGFEKSASIYSSRVGALVADVRSGDLVFGSDERPHPPHPATFAGAAEFYERPDGDDQ